MPANTLALTTATLVSNRISTSFRQQKWVLPLHAAALRHAFRWDTIRANI